jgi:uncharacterized membrane protein YfcA
MPVELPVSGVETWLWLPPLAALVVSFFTSMVGVSGAFLLLPFQMSVLGFGGPAASATNLVFNLFATPGGVWRYARDGRLAWPLAGLIVAGTLPGVVLGFYLRVLVLAEGARFQLFVGAVMLYLAWRLLADFAPWARPRPLVAVHAGARLRLVHAGVRRIELCLGEHAFGFSTPAVLALAGVVGVVGGAYGIGGGAIIAPVLVGVMRLPIHAVAGAALAGTFATSVLGVAVYSLLPVPGGGSAAPDWLLGSLFGLGGLAGMMLGAATQRHLSQRVLRLGLGLGLAGLALAYLSPLVR